VIISITASFRRLGSVSVAQRPITTSMRGVAEMPRNPRLLSTVVLLSCM